MTGRSASADGAGGTQLAANRFLIAVLFHLSFTRLYHLDLAAFNSSRNCRGASQITAATVESNESKDEGAEDGKREQRLGDFSTRPWALRACGYHAVPSVGLDPDKRMFVTLLKSFGGLGLRKSGNS